MYTMEVHVVDSQHVGDSSMFVSNYRFISNHQLLLLKSHRVYLCKGRHQSPPPTVKCHMTYMAA